MCDPRSGNTVSKGLLVRTPWGTLDATGKSQCLIQTSVGGGAVAEDGAAACFWVTGSLRREAEKLGLNPYKNEKGTFQAGRRNEQMCVR